MDISKFRVNKQKCSSCPFRKNKQGRHRDERLVARIQQDVITDASQVCHHPRLSGKAEHSLCRGARDFQLQIYFRMGFLEEPTDKCWDSMRKMMQESKKNDES